MALEIRQGIRALIRTVVPGNPPAGQKLLFPRDLAWADLNSAGVETAVAMDRGTDQGRALRTFRGSYLGGVTSSPSDILIVGASFEEGHGTTLMTNGWTQVMRDNLRKLAQPKGLAGGGSVPASNSAYQAGVGNYFGYNPFQMYPSGLYPDSPIIATAGTFNPITTFGLGLRGISALNGSSFTIEFYGTGCDLVYSTDPTWGTFTWAVDGGGTTSQATTAANSSGNRIQIRGLTRGRHTVQCVTTAAGSGGQGVQHEGAVFYDGDEASGIRVWQAAKSGAKAMDFVSGTGSTLWVNSIQTWNVPDLCIINLGFNDIFATTGARTAAQVKTDLQSIITLVKNRCTTLGAVTPSFVVMASFNVNPGGTSAPVDTWPNAVKAIYDLADADDDVCVFDYQHWFGKVSETAVSTRGGILVADGLHPTDGGAAIIGGAITNFLLDSSERMRDIVRYGTSIRTSALPAVTTPLGASEFPVNEAGTSKKMTLAQINAYTEPVRSVITAAQTLTTAADTYITNSAIILPQPRMQGGVVYRCYLVLTKTAAGVTAPVLTVRLGTAGTLSDAALSAFTGIAQTGVVDTAFLEFMCVFRAHSSTATIYSSYRFDHKLASTGFMTQSATADGGVSGSVNTTTANVRIGISLNAAALGAWTVQAGEAQLENLL